MYILYNKNTSFEDNFYYIRYSEYNGDVYTFCGYSLQSYVFNLFDNKIIWHTFIAHRVIVYYCLFISSMINLIGSATTGITE